jgi:membrane protein
VVLTIAGSILVTIPLKLVGTAAHQALLSILRWPLLYLALLLPLPVPIATAEPQPSQWRWGGGHLGKRHCRRARLVGSLALSWYVSNFGNHSAAYGSVVAVIVHLIVLAGAEINAETDIRPPATATLKRPGGYPARMADEIGQAKT